MTTPVPEATYSGNPMDSMRDEVRFLVQDTGAGGYFLISNAELDYLIDYYGPRFDDSALYVASAAAKVIARQYAGVTAISADGVSVSVGDLTTRFNEVASQLLRDHKAAQAVGGAVDNANLMWDSELDASIAALNFGIGDMDNPLAGHQAIQGHRGPRYDADENGWVY